MPTAVTTKDAPTPVGPYSQAIIAGGMVYVAGQGPIDPSTGEFDLGDVTHETQLTLNNIKAILEAAGTSVDNVVKVGVYLTDLANFADMNAVYSKFFGDTKPARTTVGTALGFNIKVEIDCIAALPE